MEPLIELTDSINWNRLYTSALNAELDTYGGVKVPIPPVEFTLNSHAMVIGVLNGNAPLRWRLGAWLQILAPRINTGSTSAINAPVELMRYTLSLRSRHLIRIPEYGILPYTVRLEFPKWHSAMLVDAWWYDDTRYDVTQEMLKEINAKLS